MGYLADQIKRAYIPNVISGLSFFFLVGGQISGWEINGWRRDSGVIDNISGDARQTGGKRIVRFFCVSSSDVTTPIGALMLSLMTHSGQPWGGDARLMSPVTPKESLELAGLAATNLIEESFFWGGSFWCPLKCYANASMGSLAGDL